MFLESLVSQLAVSLIIGLMRLRPAKMDKIEGFRQIRLPLLTILLVAAWSSDVFALSVASGSLREDQWFE